MEQTLEDSVRLAAGFHSVISLSKGLLKKDRNPFKRALTKKDRKPFKKALKKRIGNPFKRAFEKG